MVQPIYDFIYDVDLLFFTEAERAGWMEDPFAHMMEDFCHIAYH